MADVEIAGISINLRLVDSNGSFPLLIRNAVEAVASLGDISGIVLHGSQITEHADNLSDIDLVVIVRSGGLGSNFRLLDGRSLDITWGTLESLSARLERPYKNNANFLLYALCHGVCCRDDTGDVSKLVSKAKLLFDKGPIAPSNHAIETSKLQLLRLLRSSERLVRRAGQSDNATSIASMRCDRLATQALYAYYWARGLWTVGIGDLLRSAEIEQPALYSAWSAYASARSLTNRLSCAKCLAQLAHDIDLISASDAW